MSRLSLLSRLSFNKLLEFQQAIESLVYKELVVTLEERGEEIGKFWGDLREVLSLTALVSRIQYGLIFVSNTTY